MSYRFALKAMSDSHHEIWYGRKPTYSKVLKLHGRWRSESLFKQPSRVTSEGLEKDRVVLEMHTGEEMDYHGLKYGPPHVHDNSPEWLEMPDLGDWAWIGVFTGYHDSGAYGDYRHSGIPTPGYRRVASFQVSPETECQCNGYHSLLEHRCPLCDCEQTDESGDTCFSYIGEGWRGTVYAPNRANVKNAMCQNARKRPGVRKLA